MSIHLSKEEARIEAMRIASDFASTQFAGDNRWEWSCCEPQPDVFASDFKQRKTVVKWSVAIQIIPKNGGTFDSGPIVLVDILKKDARFADE